MKTMMRMLVIFFCLALILPGCDKEPPFVEELPINIELWPTEPTPDYMGTSTVTWKVTGEYKRVSVSINGFVISTESKGTKNLCDLTTEQIVQVSVFQDNVSEPVGEKRITISPQPEVVTPNPILTVIAPDTVNYNTEVNISWTSSNLKGLTLNGNSVPLNHSLATGKLLNDTVYVFLATGLNDSTFFLEKSLIVRPPAVPTFFDFLPYLPWYKTKKEKSYTLDGPWTELDVWFCEEDDKMTFSFNPNLMVIDRGQNMCDGQTLVVWTFDFTLNGFMLNDKQIITLDWDHLVWFYSSFEIQPDGITTREIFIRETYSH